MNYDLGETARVRVAFFKEDKSPMDAVDPIIRAKRPDGTFVMASYVVKEAMGKFYADFTCDMAGNWYVKATCLDPTATAKDSGFSVNESYFEG